MKQILKTKTVPAPVADVWRVWTSSKGAQEFFSSHTDIELRPGGKYEILFDLDKPEGQRGSEGMRVLSFVPQEMLSFEWNAPPHLPQVRSEKTWVVVNFAKLGEASTEVTLKHLGWKEGSEWQQAYDYFQRAWGFVMENLERRFLTGPIDWTQDV